MAEQRFRWNSPYDWLEEHIDDLDARLSLRAMEEKRTVALLLAARMDSDTLQDLFQEEMDEDGYFRSLDPDSEDYAVSDVVRGGYDVSVVDGGFVGHFDDLDACAAAIREHAGDGWQPDVWIISDHGNAAIWEDFDWEGE